MNAHAHYWFMFLYYAVLGFVGIAALIDSIKVIKPVTYGVLIRFGGRVKEVLYERQWPYFTIPFVTKLFIVSLERESTPVIFSFVTYGGEKDGERIKRATIEGTAIVQWRADPSIKTLQGYNKFIEFLFDHFGDARAKQVIVEGMQERLEAVIGGIVSQTDLDYALNHIKALTRYLACSLIMAEPPHVRPELFRGGEKGEIKDQSEKIVNGKITEKKMGKIEARIEFYEEYSEPIGNALRAKKKSDATITDIFPNGIYPQPTSLSTEIELHNKKRKKEGLSLLTYEQFLAEKIVALVNSHSEVEDLYGIEIIDVGLPRLKPDEDTEEFLRMEKQKEEELKAQELGFTKTMQWANAFKDLSIEAVNAAQTQVGVARKQVISHEGLGDKNRKVILVNPQNNPQGDA